MTEPTPPDMANSYTSRSISVTLPNSNESNGIDKLLRLELQAPSLAAKFLSEGVSSFVETADVTLKFVLLPATDLRKNTTVIFQGDGTSNESVEIDGEKVSVAARGRKVVAIVAQAKWSFADSSEKLRENFEKVKAIASNVLTASLFVQNPSFALGVEKMSVPVGYKVSINKSSAQHSFRKGGRVFHLERWKDKVECVFFDTNLMDWSTHGCRIIAKGFTQQSCTCNHTSAFAVMLSLYKVDLSPALIIFTNALEGISVLALLVTLLAFITLKSYISNELFLTHFSITLSLLLLHFSFMLGSLAVTAQNASACKFAAVFSHLWLITSAAWTLIESILLYRKTRNTSLSFNPFLHLKKILFAGWVIPVIYVSLCGTVGFLTNRYMDKADTLVDSSGVETEGKGQFAYDRCWLSTESLMILTVVIPLTVIYTTNAIIMVCVLRKARIMSKEAQKRERLSLTIDAKGGSGRHSDFITTCKATLILLPLLGVPWLIGLFVNIPGASSYFVAVHSTLNGLQGAFVAIVFCIIHRNLRKTVKRKLFSSLNDRQFAWKY